jgi:hypothetical protein
VKENISWEKTSPYTCFNISYNASPLSSGPGTGFTQPREYNWEATWMEIVAAPGLENREYGRGDPLRWPRDTLYPQKLALTSPTSDGPSVGILRLRTKASEFLYFTFSPFLFFTLNCISFPTQVLLICLSSLQIAVRRRRAEVTRNTDGQETVSHSWLIERGNHGNSCHVTQPKLPSYCHDDIWGSGGTAPLFFTPLLLYSRG